jgi:hypothetical protein
MHKKIAFILALMVFVSVPAFCADTNAFKFSIGFDHLLLGFLQRDPRGNVEANLGISMGLGISYRRYFDSLKFNSDFDPARTEKFSPFWEIGTLVLFLPYGEIGVDYAWTNGFYLGAGLIVCSVIRYAGPGYVGYIGPEIHGGLMF